MNEEVINPETGDSAEGESEPRGGALDRAFAACGLIRSFRRSAYDPGDRLEYEVTGVTPAHVGRIAAEVEQFVGGGFAGQVYRVRLLDVQAAAGRVEGLEIGKHYAIKILIPPSGFAKFFRDLLYLLAFQSPFSAQVLPAAMRTGVLWQKLIRRAAAVDLGLEGAVCDTYATFHDRELGSFGEINEWIDGRIWKFEADDRLLERWKFEDEPPVGHNSPEYVHKKLFMRRLVDLLHRMGAGELARQYQWWTGKSQPNALKRVGAEESPKAGLTAIDFRAGLALLPFLPMSFADIPLILKGLLRGRLAQFDRCDMSRLRSFIDRRREDFADLEPAIAELEQQYPIYRASQLDLTGHHVRLLTSRDLRRSIKEGAITAWKSLGLLDDEHEARLRDGRGPFSLLFLTSFLPLLGYRLIRLWGQNRSRRHAKRCLTSLGYLGRAMKGARLEGLIRWLRDERILESRALGLAGRPVRFWSERLLVGWLPPAWHRFLTDSTWARQRLRQSYNYTMSFLREPEFREQVLLEQVRLGHEEGMLTAEETARIEAQVKDPFIQKYLRCLAVHLCTVPVTQVVMILAGAAVTGYCLVYRQLSWPESLAFGAAAGAAIQLMPISPGSIARGVFVLYLMIRERDVRNYYIAAPVSFLHVIGYLAFPLQMMTHNPALARFLAGRWTKQTVHIVPVFGEAGGLLEHGVFDLFFNLPLTIARGLREKPLKWLSGLAAIAAVTFLLLFGAFCRLWEWRQPKIELSGVLVESTVPYYQSGLQIHWGLRGVRAQIEGAEGVVDFPARRWVDAVDQGDRVDATIRKSFFGDEFDGLNITHQ